MMCAISDFKCKANSCTKHYTGEKDRVFFLTETLGVGEEVLWDFLGWLDFGRLSFTKFCEQTTHIYHSVNPLCANFVSNRTFIDLFFSWVVCFDFDFRDEIDPFCGHDPVCLACDGTHIGISIKHLLLKEPITEPELQDHVPSSHTGMDRTFLPYGEKGDMTWKAVFEMRRCVVRVRQFLKDECKKLLTGEDDLNARLSGMTEVEQVKERERVATEYRKNRELLVECLAWGGVSGYLDFLTLFLDRSVHSSVVKVSGRIIKLLLSIDTAVTTVIPFRYLDHLKECCDAVEAGEITSQQLYEMEGYSKEFSELIQASMLHNCTEVVIQFLRCLMTFVTDVHKNDRLVPDASPIPFTYNPVAGTAYYFTEHGCKLRECGVYDLKETDKVDRGDPNTCQKYFPQVSYGGFGYMFLFFCPLHGHCYGFHMIQGGEGRKDPFSALFKYKPSPPKEVFYDFACQLQEYSLNREPEFFKWVRFWHDLFHGVNHKCQPAFKSTRVNGLGGVNSEVCEQFNSYMKSIKFTGSSLSQVHFVLFSQFMIFRWNRAKTTAFQAVANTSLRGIV